MTTGNEDLIHALQGKQDIFRNAIDRLQEIAPPGTEDEMYSPAGSPGSSSGGRAR